MRPERDLRGSAADRPLRAVRDGGEAAGAPPPLQVLEAAAEAVRAQQAQALGTTPHLEEASPSLEWLVQAVTAAMGGMPVEPIRPAANALGVHLLDLLRAEVVRAWRASGPPSGHDAAFELLDALEQVGKALEPDWSNQLATHLHGPDGLGILVGLAHDLRSPLTSVLFLAETLARGKSGPVNELQGRQLRLIYSAALALNSLSSDVIELSRGAQQLIEKESELFSIAELVEWLRDMVLPIAEEKHVEVRYVLPPTDRRLGRPLALSRVLLNLLTNALKFTEKGFVEVSGVARGLSAVEFAVRDTGGGISPEAAATLYEPFRRTTGRNRRGSGYRFSGTGLGLALCRRLCEAMGSELKYETRPDWGTRFYFQVDLPPATRL
jgi:two-component sensor histidine kinase